MPHNSSTSNCNMTDFRYPAFRYTYSVVLALGLPLNVVALWTFVRLLWIRKSVPIIYMTNLVLSDLLFILSLPVRILYFFTGRWTLGPAVCMISGTLFSVNLYSSSLFIMMVSVDRFLAVVYPLRSRTVRTAPVAWAICLAVWVVIVALAVPVALSHQPNFDEKCNVTRCFEFYSEDSWNKGFTILCIVSFMGILLPFCIIMGCTIAIIHQLKGMVMASSASSSSSLSIKSMKKMVWLFLSNLMIYAVCFIPFHVLFILYGLYKKDVLKYNFLDMQTVAMCMASTNSCLDPLVYYFSIKSLQKRSSGDSKKSREERTTFIPF